jgi:hypothetical protein
MFVISLLVYTLKGHFFSQNQNMKILPLSLMVSVLIVVNSFGQATETGKNQTTEFKILKFYSQYFRLWENTRINNATPANFLYKKLDSLMQVYCTVRFRKQAKEVFDNVGADLVSNNLVSVVLNEDLKVEKEKGLENTFVVSFNATDTDFPKETAKKRVVLRVKVVKSGNEYKIDAVN